MIYLQKRRLGCILRWFSSSLVENHTVSSKVAIFLTGSFYTAANPRLYGTSPPVSNEIVSKTSTVTRKEAQAALLEYLHLTRNLPFTDADHMSKNSPKFVEKLVERFDKKLDVQRLVARYLRYHPINEFEPFFESLGLNPYEYSPFLPRNLMFLSDDELLLENYRVLGNYGVARNKIGMILKEAPEVFRFDVGVLQSKLQAYEILGLSQSFICKVIVCSPRVLIGDVNTEFVKTLETLKSMEIQLCWIEEHFSEQGSGNWGMMLRLLRLFKKIGFNDNQLCKLLRQHPGLLLEGSGHFALAVIGLLLKFGSTGDEICLTFMQFPQIEVRKFLLNLNQCLSFLFEINMKVHELGIIFRSHFVLLGSSTLKRTNTILANLNVGKKRLCEYIQENPLELKKFSLGTKLGRLPAEKERSQKLKAKFLVDVGYIENSNEMEKALKVFRGRGAKLPERFDCIVKAGLDRKDVCKMIKVSPQILNMKKDVIKMKIDFLVNYLGYPVSFLVSFPSYFNYTAERIKLRLSMSNWLKDQGMAEPTLALSTLIAYSDKTFIRQFVNQHPNGPEVWQNLKKQIYAEKLKVSLTE